MPLVASDDKEGTYGPSCMTERSLRSLCFYAILEQAAGSKPQPGFSKDSWD
jgi:hypothetical protein